MTSSLVGSEMCIRDRVERLHQVVLTGLRKQCLQQSQQACAEVTGRGPVSYTHLTLPTICSV
eukprot:3102003-Prorocentrum_lima.AAC.1